MSFSFLHVKMEDTVICKNCKSQSSVTPYTQKIRCLKCEGIISVGINQVPILTETDRQYSQEQDMIITDTKGIHSLFRRLSGTTCSPKYASQSTKTNDSSCDSISTWKAIPGKRALLCGVSYYKQKFRLRGTINDVNSMRDLLVNRFNFPSSSIHILAEDKIHQHPTKKNMQAAFQWLVKDCQPGDSLVFYFSGHGLRQPDFDKDERDGFDETLCPVDFKTEGMIIDNEINEAIVRPLKPGVKLHAIIDACHSGTVLDLPYYYSIKEKKWVDNRPPSGANKNTSGGQAISFSACEDNQLAADTSAFSPGHEMVGAMTYSFIKAVQENPKITYGGLLTSMHKVIKEAREAGFLNLRRIFHRKIVQEPLLSSSQPFDINLELKL